MRVKLQIATAGDVADLMSLRKAVNRHMVAQHGKGYWSVRLTARGALFAMRNSRVYIARHRKRPIATLALSTRKPWAIDGKYFSPSKRPLYLTAMEISPEHQRQGVGKLCLEEVCRIARKWPADAIRLDAWDAEAGGGEFYRKFGFREVGRATYRNTPLIYFELLL
jgi:GNAT superfamily N-acetyltransferase